jgi:alkylation response protein AidB-like acyl-CoA dehydrogenase
MTTNQVAEAFHVAATPVLSSAAEAIAAARDYAASIADGAIERDRAGKVPYPELAALDASGLLGITVPAAFGGPDLPPTVLAEVIAAIAAVDPAIAQIPQAHFLFVDVLAIHGSPKQQRRLFGEVLAGARFGNAQAERGGQHAQDLKTRLQADPDGRQLRLDGRKYYTTGAISARWIGVSALDAAGRLVLAFVDRRAPGVTIDEDWDVMGQRATVSGTATFEGVPVDPALVVPYASAFEVPQQLGARTQLVHTAIQVGIARGALRDARTFVLAEVTRFPVDAKEAARGSIAVAEAKAFASDIAVEVASDLFALAGASAADERHDLSRHWRNARTHASHDPVDWKYHHVGNYLLNDALPPNHGQL